MVARKRITGSTLSLKIGDVEYNADVSEYNISEDDKDSGTLTFADAAGGKSGALKLSVTFVQSLDAQSLHQQLMDNPGRADVSFVLAPYGNAKASAEAPHFTGKIRFPRNRPDLGIKAGDEDNTSEAEFSISEWKKVTA